MDGKEELKRFELIDSEKTSVSEDKKSMDFLELLKIFSPGTAIRPPLTIF